LLRGLLHKNRKGDTGKGCGVGLEEIGCIESGLIIEIGCIESGLTTEIGCIESGFKTPPQTSTN
jgi:hypothetical protein